MKCIAKLLKVNGTEWKYDPERDKFQVSDTTNYTGGTDPYHKLFAVVFEEPVKDVTPRETTITQEFKVIGEISPDAHWVKDGDEIEVMRGFTEKSGSIREIFYTEIDSPSNDNMVFLPYLYAKCPTCNTYH